MLRRHLAALVVTLLACSAAGALIAEPASARLAPSISMTSLTPRIDVNTGPRFGYTTTGAPAGSVVQLQRLLADATWATVATVPLGANKTVTAPAVHPLGKYTYRMQIVHSGALVARAKYTHDIYAYDNVSIESLCPHTAGTRACVHSKTVVGGVQVRTHMAIGAAVFPNYFAGANFGRTSCRSASLVFTNPHTATSKTWLKFHQPGHADQGAATNRNVLGHLNATLYGGQVYFDGSTELSTNSVYLDGTMSCWTTTGTY